MKKRIAIPIEHGKLCAHFGHCQEFTFIDIENGQITNVETHTPPEHVPGLFPKWVASFGTTDVIAGGMGQQAVHLFNMQNINVFVGAPVKAAVEIVSDFLTGTLQLHANDCNHDGHQHHEGCQH
mgnify:CR=1 FL=1